MEPILRVKDLSKSFSRAGKNEFFAVDHVSFDVMPGEILSLVGESGCGKSITVLSILGLLRPPGRVTGGEIRYQGQNLLELSEKQLDAIRGLCDRHDLSGHHVQPESRPLHRHAADGGHPAPSAL